MSKLERRGMLPSDLYEIVAASDPQLSSQGTHVAFVATRMDRAQNRYWSNLWIVDVTAGQARQLTRGIHRDRSPRFSPDGRHLAFISDRSGVDQVWILPLEGGEPWKLTGLRDQASEPVWSPDGGSLAFLGQVATGTDPLRERDPGAPPDPPRVRVIERLKYKFNGEGDLDRPTQLFVIALDGGPPRQLTTGEPRVEEPAWSPNGREIAFVSAREPERDYDIVSDVWAVRLGDGALRKLTKGEGPVASPAWSPDGERLAYVGHTFPEAGGGYNVRLRLVSAQGGDSRTVTDRLDRSLMIAFRPAHIPAPVWAPDGTFVYFLHQDRGAVALSRIRPEGGEVDVVVGGDRSLTGFALAPDGRTVVFATSWATNPGEIFAVDVHSRFERQLTQLNRAWLSRVELSAPERIEARSSDGTVVDAWLMRPHGFQPGRTYPTLLNVHGGPHGQYGWPFFDEFQVQAGAGYVVVYGNPRGSQGYGEQFALSIRGDWGNHDYADVLAIADRAEQEPYVDRERMGVLGGSYGGYMTSWVVGHTDRFKAACSERAVNFLFSHFGTSDMGNIGMSSAWGGTPQERPDIYLERSPLMYVERMRTPLLILHSEQDLRCNLEQAEQLYVALKRLGREVRFVRFPGESHEMSRSGRPHHRVERFQHILQWFARYLGEAAPAPAAQTVKRAAGSARRH
jgi:dipeptidyl aminopeptidase/acylaminoacyl peptidase